MLTPSWLIVWAAVGAGGPRPAYPQSIPVPAGTPAPVCKRLEACGRDGVKLAVHEWAPPKAAGKPVVVFLHGIGMHGEPYGAIAPGFTAHGVPFVVPDLRGHGRSGGTRGELAPPHVLRADLGAVLDLVTRRYPGAPVVLVGDSMGGVLAADYAWRGERRLAGLALLVPAFAVNQEQLGRAANGALSLLGGRVRLGTQGKLASSTRSAGFLKARLADRRALASISASYLLTIGSLQTELRRAPPEVRLPLFVCVAGGDKVIDNAAAKQFFDRARTAAADKTWLRVKGACHTVCWDPETPRLVEELVRWVLQRARPAASACGPVRPLVR
jgi:alpha-beta hydrolase superfamily lysophospholipase